MSDFINKATDALDGLKDNPLLDKAEDPAEAEIPARGRRLIVIDSRALAIGPKGRLRGELDADRAVLKQLLA